MATSTFNWTAWDTTNSWQNLADAGNNADLTYARDGTDVAAKFTETAKNRTSVEYARKSGTGDSWASIFGIYPTNTVSQVRITAWKKKVVTNTKLTSHTITFKLIDDSANTIATMISASAMATGTDANYVTMGATSASAIGAAYTSGSTPVRLSLEYRAVIANSSGASAIDTRFDDITIEITYALTFRLTVNDATQTQSAEKILLRPRDVYPKDTQQLQTSDSVALNAHYILASVGNCNQLHTADNLILDAPPTTTLGTPVEGYQTSASAIDFKFTGVDIASHRVDYEIQIDTDPAFSSGSISLDQICPISETNTGSAVVITFSTAPASNSLVVVGISQWDSGLAGVSGIEDNQGNTYYEAISSIDGTTTYNSSIWYAKNVISSGTFEITVTMSSVGCDTSVGAASFTKIDRISPLSGIPNTSAGSDSAPVSGSIASENTALYFGNMMWAVISSASAVVPWTQLFTLNYPPSVSSPLCAEYLISTGEQTASWALDASGVWRTAIAAFKAGSGIVDALSTNHTGFSAGENHPTDSGVEQTFTTSASLTVGTYYWRVRATDTTSDGTFAGWGGWSGSKSFEITTGGGATLTIQSATQLQVSNNVVLAQNYILTVQDSIQLQTSDIINLIQNYILTIQDSAQLQTSDIISLIQNYILTLQDSTQLQTADGNTITFTEIEDIVLIVNYSLQISDSSQLQTSDNTTLTAYSPPGGITVQDSTQLQTSDNISFILSYSLTVQDSTQLQSIDNYRFIDGVGGDVNTACDTIVYKFDPTTNYGTGNGVGTRGDNLTTTLHGLMKFTLTSLEGKTINSVLLYLYQEAGDNGDDANVEIHRLLPANSGWTELGATWNHAVEDTVEWAGSAGASTSGVDYATTLMGTWVYVHSNLQFHEYIVSLDPAEFSLMVENNAGLIIRKDTGEISSACSSDVGNTDYYPKLVVLYTVPLNLTQHYSLTVQDSSQLQSTNNYRFIDGFDGDVDTAYDTYNSLDDHTTIAGLQTLLMARQLTGNLGDYTAYTTLIKFTLSSLVGKVIKSATMYIYRNGSATWYLPQMTFTYNRILDANSDWSEAWANWDYKNTQTPSYWAGDTGHDGGSDGGCNQSGIDFTATVLGTFVLSADNADPEGTEYSSSWDITEFSNLVNGSNSVILHQNQDGYGMFFSSDHATTAYRPKLVVLYETPLTLSQTYSLTVQDTIQTQTSDNVVLTAYSPAGELTVQNAVHVLNSDNINLTFYEHYGLSVQNVTQLQTSDNVVLTQHQILAVNNATQTQTSDTAFVYLGIIINIDFETGDTSQFTSVTDPDGDLAVLSAAALGGTGYGLSGSVVSEDTKPFYGTIQLNNTSYTNTVRTRFYFNTTGVDMSMGMSITLLIGYNETDNDIFKVTFSYLPQYNAILPQVKDDNDEWIGIAGMFSQGNIGYVEFLTTRATSASSSDGTFSVWVTTGLGVGENLIGTRNDIDNYDTFTSFKYLQFGVPALNLGSFSATAYLDELVVRDDGKYIGPNIYAPVINTTHALSSDNVNLTQHQILTVNDSSHGQISENIDLTQHQILSVYDSTHIQMIIFVVSDAFNRPDGPLGYTESPNSLLWTGNTWSISNGSAINTPNIGPEVMLNGGFETGNPPDSWGTVNAALLFERSASQVHDGSYSGHLVTADYSGGIAQYDIVTPGNWYRTITWLYTAGGMFINLPTQVEYFFYLPTNQWVKTVSIYGTGTTSLQFISTYANDFYLDGITTGSLSQSELFASIDTGNSDITIEAGLIWGGFYQRNPVGLILKADNTTNPQNFVVAYITNGGSNGWGIAALCKVINGAWTTLFADHLASYNTQYAVGGILKVIAHENEVSLYYRDTLLTTVTVSDPEIIGNTIHGLFSTFEEDSIDNFLIQNFSAKLPLKQHQILFINDCVQSQFSDNIGVTGRYTITVNDAVQLQTSDNVDLFAHYILTVQDTTQVQTSDNVNLTQHQILAVNDSAHIQYVNTQWWLAGGINPVNAIGAYQADKISSYANSKVNLANPGTNDASEGNAPNWDNINGWTFISGSSQYLTTGIIPSTGWSFIVRFSIIGGSVFGSYDWTVPSFFGISTDATYIWFSNGGRINVFPPFYSGIAAVAGEYCYENGSFTATLVNDAPPSWDIWIGGLHQNNGYVGNADVKIQGLATYDTVLTPVQVFAIGEGMKGNIVLAQNYAPLTVQDTTQIQTSDSIVLAQNYSLIVQDAIQTQTSDNINLVFYEHYSLTVQDTVQIQTSDNLALIQHQILIINNSSHLQISSPCWWLTNGVTCIAAFQPMGALDYATSKINIANPGTYNIISGSVNWTSDGGWQSANAGESLSTTDNASSGKTIIVRFSDETIVSSSAILVQAGGMNRRIYSTRDIGGGVYRSSVAVATPADYANDTELRTNGILALKDTGSTRGGVISIFFDGELRDSTEETESPGSVKGIIYINYHTLAKIQAVAVYDFGWTGNQIYTITQQIKAIDYNQIVLAHHPVRIVENSTHLQTSGNTVLTQHQVLSVNDSVHSQTSENVSLTQHYYYNLTINNSAQLQTSNNVSLTQHQVLGVNNSTQAQTSDKTNLVQHQVLTVNSSSHIQVGGIYATFIDGYNGNIQTYKDSFINSPSVDSNFGSSTAIDIGEYLGDIYRILLGFNLSSLSNYKVISAIITLYCYGAYRTYARTISVYKVLRPWVESEVTWNVYATGNSWQVAGATGALDIDSTPIGSISGSPISANSFAYINLNASDIASLGSNGFLLKENIETNSTRNFYSSDYITTPEFRPKLTIVYEAPLIQHQVLGVQNSTQTHTSDNTNLIQHQILGVNNATQTITSNNVALNYQGHYTLSAHDATQAQTSDNVILTQHQILGVNNSTQLQTSNNVVLFAHYSIVINSATQSQTSNNIILTQHQVLVINGVTQLQTSNSIALIQHQILAVQNATEVQTANAVFLNGVVPHYVLHIIGSYEALLLEDGGYLLLENGGKLSLEESTARIILPQTASNVILSAHYVLATVNSATQTQTSGNVVLTQHQVLGIQNTTQAQTAGTITLTQHQVLGVNNSSQAQTSDNVTLIQHQILGVNGATQLQTCNNVVLTQHQVLVINGATQGQTSDNVELIPHNIYALTVSDATQGQTSGNVDLIAYMFGILTMQSPVQGQTAENVALTQHQILTVNDTSQLQISANIVLLAHYTITVSDSSHLQTSDNVILTGHIPTFSLAVQNATQSQTSDNVVLVQHQILVIQDTIQGQTSDNVVLTQHYSLAVGDASQSQTADNILLVQHHILTVENATQLQISDNTILSAHYAVTTQSATQTQTADNVILTQHYATFVLEIQNSSHLQSTDTIGLTQHQILVISNAVQAQTTSNITLIAYMFGVLTMWSAVQAQTAENIVLTGHVPTFLLTANLTAANAGLASVNGDYIDSGWLNGKRYYVLFTDNDIRIWWNSASWIIGEYSTDTTYYWSSDNVVTPDLVSSWTVFIPGGGIAPAPTITSHFNAIQTQTADDITLVAHVPTYSLTINSSTQIQVANSVSLIQHHALIVIDSTQTQTVNNVILIQHYILAINNSTQVQASDNVALIQHQILIINNSTQLQVANNITLTQHVYGSLLVQNAIQLQTSNNIALTQHQILGINNSSQLQSANTIALLSRYVLTAVENVIQLQTANEIPLLARYSLTIGNATHLQTSENVILKQHHVLVVQNASQIQTANNVAVLLHLVLSAIENTTHLQTSESVTIVVFYRAVTDNVIQLQTAENVTLFAHYILSTVNNATQLQTANNIDASSHYILGTVNNAVQLQTADNITLTAYIPNFALTVNNTIHLQSALAIYFGKFYLAVNDATQLQTSSDIILAFFGIVITPDSRTFTIIAENRTYIVRFEDRFYFIPPWIDDYYTRDGGE